MVSKKEDNQPCILKLTFPLILTFSTKGLLPQDLLRIMLFGDWPRPHSIRKIEGYCSAGEKKTCFVPINSPPPKLRYAAVDLAKSPYSLDVSLCVCWLSLTDQKQITISNDETSRPI